MVESLNILERFRSMHPIHIRVLGVDGSAAIRWRLSCMLTELETVEVVGQAGDALEALELARQLNSNVVTLDLHMPGGGGLPLIEQLEALEPPPIIMVVTSCQYPCVAHTRPAGRGRLFLRRIHRVPRPDG